MRRRAGFSLVEVMIVVLVIGVIMSIAVPQWLRARESARDRTCLSNLRQIDNAKETFAMEVGLKTGDAVQSNDLWPAYIRAKNFPACPSGGLYTITVVGSQSECSVHGVSVK